MPQIETWARLPVVLRDHLVDRMRDRNITVQDLNRLRLRMESRPEVPNTLGISISVHSSCAVKASFPRRFCSLASLRLGASSNVAVIR